MSDMLKQISIINVMLTTTFLILLFCAAYQDIRKKQIPDGIISGIFVLSAAGLFLLDNPDVLEKTAGIFAVSVPMLVITMCVPGSFGGGDIKLMAACGMFLGAGNVFYSFFYALVLGGIYSIYLIICKNKSLKTEFAFGPFLAAGILLQLIFQNF